MFYSLALLSGMIVRFQKAESRNKHKRAATPQHATDHDNRGARRSSGSCSANGPGGCRIFANYCCSVRVCARGQICGLTSRQHLEKKYLVPISRDRDEQYSRLMTSLKCVYKIPLQVTPLPKNSHFYCILGVSHRGFDLGNMSGLVGENVVEKRV